MAYPVDGVIAVDTSALMAVVGRESAADACAAVLRNRNRLVVSAATVTEALIVAGRRSVGPVMEELFGYTTAHHRTRHRRLRPPCGRRLCVLGPRRPPAALNFGDCFAYALAEYHACPLLYVGNDFARTDIRSALTDP